MDKLQEIGDSKVKKDEISILVDIQKSCGFDGWYNQEGWHEVETHPSGAYGVTISHGHVTSIRLGNNGLSGPLPESIGDLEYVEEVVMNFNQLTGVLPDSLTKCKNLKYLSLNNNQMEGPLPANCANWTQMWNLQVSTWSAGRTPDARGRQPCSPSACTCCVQLNFNHFTGPITAVFDLPALKWVNLDSNHFSGSIPESIGQCIHLEVRERERTC